MLRRRSRRSATCLNSHTSQISTRCARDVNTAKADEPVEKLTAIDEWKAVLQRVLACSNHAKAMISVGILVNVVLAVTESAWFAYYSAIEAGQDD